MEDKIQISVLQDYASTGRAIDLTNFETALGRNMLSSQALVRSMVQFMCGVPVIDYGSFQFYGSTTSDGRIGFIDTIRPSTDPAQNISPSMSSPYSVYESGLTQNRSSSVSSQAPTGGYAGLYTSPPGGTGWTFYGPGSMGALRDAQGAVLTIDFPGAGAATIGDFYDPDGNFLFTVGLGPQTSGSWATGTAFTFNIVAPTYTESLNWSQATRNWGILQSTAYTNSGLGGTGYLGMYLWDGGRKTGLTSTDPLSDYDMQGMVLGASGYFSYVAPLTSNLQANPATSSGYFLYPYGTFNGVTGTGNGIYAPFTAATATTSNPATAIRGPDTFTMMRGPGYIRMVGQTKSPTTPGEYINPEYDCAYFFGMMGTYAQVDDYPNPMAFLGNVGLRTAVNPSSNPGYVRTRPFWRASADSLTTADSSIWSEVAPGGVPSGHWVARMPFVLRPDFNLSTNDTPEFTYRPASNGNNIPSMANAGNNFDSTAGPNYALTRPSYVSFFEPQLLGMDYSGRMGFAGVSNLAPQIMESFGGPQVRPFTIIKFDPDDYNWATPEDYYGKDIVANGTTGLDQQYEIFGVIHGFYHGSHIDRWNGGAKVPIPAGSIFYYNGRRLMAVHGADTSYIFHATYPSVGRSQGMVLFDMDAIT